MSFMLSLGKTTDVRKTGRDFYYHEYSNRIWNLILMKGNEHYFYDK